MRRAAALIALILCAAPAAATEDIVSGLSQDTVQITSNYTGTDIVVFGAIEHLEDTGANDVVVVVRGPDADMTVREKQWIGGIWINRDQARLVAMPSYYFIASTRPLGRIASSFTLERYAMGLNNVVPA
ncbi:MAG TPA: TIGR02186 family protein, partial [Rhizomicrobium sp.]